MKDEPRLQPLQQVVVVAGRPVLRYNLLAFPVLSRTGLFTALAITFQYSIASKRGYRWATANLSLLVCPLSEC